MPTKPLDRLMFAQGGRCFFCDAPLPKGEASVEHLVASARGGSNGDDNCVACCKAINTLFGSISLKEKLKVVLNQAGRFRCPNGAGASAARSESKPAASRPSAPHVSQESIAAVIANLKSRGNARPRRLKTLASTIKALSSLNLSDRQVEALIGHLRSTGRINVTDEQVAYKL
jgi:hypothetical protein